MNISKNPMFTIHGFQKYLSSNIKEYRIIIIFLNYLTALSFHLNLCINFFKLSHCQKCRFFTENPGSLNNLLYSRGVKKS